MSLLETRIIEVATWILKVNPEFECNYFRSEQLRPVTKIKVERKLSLTSLEAVSRVVAKRHDALQAADIPLLTMREALSYGKLIYAYPSDSTLDGGAELYSQGLVDIWEIPAWDTWITLGNHEFNDFAVYENCVIGWIPESVYNLFYSGKAVGLEDNIGWITQLTSNSILVGSAIEPAHLDFIEIADQGAIENRLKLINQYAVAEADFSKPHKIALQAASTGSTLWAKIKRWLA